MESSKFLLSVLKTTPPVPADTNSEGSSGSLIAHEHSAHTPTQDLFIELNLFELFNFISCIM